jgi:ubiquitin carboxyl-terminal hydrolase 5/13
MCSSCKKETTFKEKKSFLKFPKMLCVVLNRFVTDNWVPRKLEVDLDIPQGKEGDLPLDFDYFKSKEEREPCEQEGPKHKDEGREIEVDMEMVKDLVENGVPENGAKHAVYRKGRKGFAHALEWYYLNADDPEVQNGPPVKSYAKNAPKKSLEQLGDMSFSLEQAKRGLRKCNNNVTRASKWILDHLSETDTEEYDLPLVEEDEDVQEPVFEETASEVGSYSL